MVKLPVVSANELIRVLRKLGYKQVRQSGSHIVLQKKEEGKTTTVIIPNYSEIAKGTLKSILRKTGIQSETLVKLLE